MSRGKLIAGLLGGLLLIGLTITFALVATLRVTPSTPPPPASTPTPLAGLTAPPTYGPTITPRPVVPTQISGGPTSPPVLTSSAPIIKNGECNFENKPPSYIRPEHYAALQPQFRQSDNLNSVRTLYELEVTVNPAQATYSGRATITFTNRAPQPMAEVVVRTYPNFYRAVGGELNLSEASLNGREATLQEKALTYNTIQSGEPVAPCSVARLSLRFEGKLPNQLKVEAYSVGAQYVGQNFLALANFYPQLAVWEKLPGRSAWDWTITPVQPSSDLTAAESAFYDVRLAVPPSYQIIASGVSLEAGKTVGDYHLWRFVGGPFREFAAVGSEVFAVNPSVKSTAQGVSVKVVTLSTPNSTLAAHQEDFARKALDATVATLDEFGAAIAPYPYTQFTLVQFPLVGFNGIEWPMFTQLSFDLFQRSYTGQEQSFANLLYSKPGTQVVIHEVLHQWWYNLVGNDQQAEPFLDEGLTEYCSYLLPELVAKRTNSSAEAAHNFAESWLDKLRIRIKQQDLPTFGDLKVNSPASEVTLDQAGFIYYRKAPLFYDAYRTEFGDAAFFNFLKNYFQRYQYKLVHFPDLAEQLIAAVPGRESEVRDLVERWFNAKKLADEIK